MKALAAMFAYFWRAERKWFLAGMAASAFTVLTSVALLGLAGWFISACALAGAGGIGLSFNFFQPSAAIRFLAIGRTVGRYAERLVTHDTTLRFLSTLRVDLFRGFARQPMQQLASLRSGQMLERITVDVDALDNLYLRLAMPVLVFAVTTSVLTATMLAVSLTLAMAVMALLLTAVSVVCTGGLLARKVAKRRAFALEALRVRTIDLVRAQTEFIVAGSLGLQQGKALDAAQRVAEASYRLQVLQLVADAVLSLMSATCLGAVFLLAASHFHRGDIDAPRLVLLVLVTLVAVECLGPLRRGVLEFSRTALAAKRVVPILKWPFAAGGPMQALTRPTVRLLDVEYRAAPKSAPLLQHITLCVEPGQRVAITGASGSGKSTLLALAAGVIQPTLGSVTVGSGPPQLGARTIGLLTQRTELLRDTVANNLRLAAPHADDAALWSALATVELADTVRALPRGLDCVLGEGGCGLSGGQARRLALARIVLLSPAVWLLDEPTAGMDDDLASRVMRNIAVAAGRATLLVACHHDRERVVAGRTVHMHMGTLDLGQSCTGEGRAL